MSTKYEATYNPILEYWSWINRNRRNRRRVSTKIYKVYKELIRIMTDPTSEWEYDPVKGNHAIEFVENYCRHSKGAMGGKRFYLSCGRKPWSPLTLA